MIYFDSAATTLRKPPQVAVASAFAIDHFASPGRGGHEPAFQAAEAVYGCRALAAELFEAKTEQVVFTMNATHALNLAIRSLVKPGDQVVISGFEHNAVRRPLYLIGADVQIAGRRLFDPEDTYFAFSEAITSKTKAVICTHVSNVFGYILPIEKIAALCKERNVPLIIDASQSAGVLPVSLKNTGAAFIAMPGHKSLYGPQGTGILLCARVPEPLLAGGTGSNSKDAAMPDDLPDAAEAGTHNVAGIHGLAAGIRFVLDHGTDAIRAKEDLLRRTLAHKLMQLSDLRLFSDDTCQTGVLSFLRENEDSELTARHLSEQGICVRAGLHCAPLAHESAGTIDTGTVRVSFGWFNSLQETEELIRALKKF